jgi:hypothetical protein
MSNIIMHLPPCMIRLFLWLYRHGMPYRSDRCASQPIICPRRTWKLV